MVTETLSFKVHFKGLQNLMQDWVKEHRYDMVIETLKDLNASDKTLWDLPFLWKCLLFGNVEFTEDGTLEVPNICHYDHEAYIEAYHEACQDLCKTMLEDLTKPVNVNSIIYMEQFYEVDLASKLYHLQLGLSIVKQNVEEYTVDDITRLSRYDILSVSLNDKINPTEATIDIATIPFKLPIYRPLITVTTIDTLKSAANDPKDDLWHHHGYLLPDGRLLSMAGMSLNLVHKELQSLLSETGFTYEYNGNSYRVEEAYFRDRDSGIIDYRGNWYIYYKRPTEAQINFIAAVGLLEDNTVRTQKGTYSVEQFIQWANSKTLED